MQPAFGERERNKLIKQVTEAEPARLDRLNPAVPRDLVTVVHKAIEREPSHRYATAAELEADLQRFLNDEPIRARRIGVVERLQRWGRRINVQSGIDGSSPPALAQGRNTQHARRFGSFVFPGVSPALAQGWQFLWRTALEPRAPSLVS